MIRWPKKKEKPKITIIGLPEPLKTGAVIGSPRAQEPMVKIQGKEPLRMPPPSKEASKVTPLTERQLASDHSKQPGRVRPGITVTIGDKSSESHYQVVATSSLFPDRKEQSLFKIPFHEEDLDDMLDELSCMVQDPREALAATIQVVVRRETEGVGEETKVEKPLIRALGQSFFEALFNDDLKSLYADTVYELHAQFPIVIETTAPEIARLPWEYLYDGERFLCTDIGPIFRVVPDAPPISLEMQVIEPLRLLVVPTNPPGSVAIDWQVEVSNIRHSLRNTNFTIDVPETQEISRFMSKLLTYQPHVLHFIGHGEEDGNILFKNDRGESVPVGEVLAEMMLNLPLPPRLIIFNACYTAAAQVKAHHLGLAARAVKSRVPMVVAMQFAISDRAAHAFAKGFYEYIAAGLPIHRGTAWGRLAIKAELQETVEWGTPVVYANPGVDLS